jgi:NAD(P)-dependent dehydrogenase (short-subunit alcohol dehydrogenase family)
MAIAGRALIVGNTDGIGLALTMRLLASGWTVVGLSRRASALEAPGYHHGVADVSAEEYRPRLQKLQASQGPFDVCVYCAGVGEWLDLDNLAGETHIFRVNLIGAVETAAVVLPPMIAAGRGHFIGLSSIGDGVSTEAPSYAASKAGLSSYLEGLALALRPRGVRVTNLRLGFVETKMAKSRVRPFMITVDRAVDIILRCFRQRPGRMTYPRRMAALAWLLGRFTSMKLWFKSPP